MFEFGSPVWLWSVLIIPVLWFIARRSRVLQLKNPRRLAMLTRATILLCLILALADLRWTTTTDETAVLFVVDNSASVQADGLVQASEFIDSVRKNHPDRNIAVATQFPSPEMLDAFDSEGPEEWTWELISTDRSPLAPVIDWARLAAHASAPTRIVLLTDGLVSDTQASLLALARSQNQGTPVDLVQLRPNRSPELELSEVSLPGTMEPGRPFDLPITVHSTVDQAVEINIFQNEWLVRKEIVRANAGATQVTISALVPEPGAGTWRIEATGAADTRPDNHALEQFSSASGATRVVFFDPMPASLAPAVLAAERAGMQTESRRPADFPNSMDELAGFDVVVLSNTPASALGDSKQQLLAEWVRSTGGGLLVAGGPDAYAAGGYFGTALAGLLPVVTDYVDHAELSVAALMVSLDRSGSMSAPVAGTTKMALANAGAVRAMELLDPTDLFGVHAVDTEVHPILPLAPVSDRASAAKILQSITSGGGGIYVFTALTASYRELSSAKATVKHVILFSDAADAEEKMAPPGSGVVASALDLASAMLSARISVSVVALGAESDPDIEFLRALAARGGGRFYRTSDATTLPRIFAEETLRATQNSLIENPFIPVLAAADQSLDGVDWSSAPPLEGYNAVQARPDAPPAMLTESDTPLLASWRQGLGRVTAFTSDINGRWSKNWQEWPGFSQWMVQSLRSLVPPTSPGSIAVQTDTRSHELVVKIDITNPDGSYRTGAAPMVTWSDGRSPQQQIPARPIASGTYEAVLDLPEGDSGLVSVSVGEEQVTKGWSRPPTNEPWVLRDSSAFFDAAVVQAGGMLNPAPQDVFRPVGRSVSVSISWVSWLIGLAILLWPVDIWIRRRTWSV